MQFDLFALSYRQVETFLLILVRVATLFVIAPIFGNRNLPAQLKAAFSLLVSLLLLLSTPLVAEGQGSKSLFDLAAHVSGEFFVGFIIAYAAYLLFVGIQIAGQIIDIQIGFGLVNVVDPQSNTQVSILGQFYYLISILVFLAMDGHLILLRALGESFRLVPVGSFLWISKQVSGPILSEFFTKLFLVAFQVAAPAVATLFLSTLAMGILSRTIPQMNIFIVGLPLGVLVGLLITFFSLHLLGAVLHSVVSDLGQSITKLLGSLAS